MNKSLQVLNAIFKVLICPFFFFLTYIALSILGAIVDGSFKINYGESVEGIALMTIFIAPIGFIITLFIVLIILRVMNKFTLLQNEKFLMILGAIIAILDYLLLRITDGIVEIFYLLF